MFKANMVALITPMHEDGTIDKSALCDIIEWHIAEKTMAIIPAGTTGESATLGYDEKVELISLVAKQVNGRIPVIAGTGDNSTQRAIDLSLAAKKAGADACLVVTPYYNKPTQLGLYEHYKHIATNSELPIILYNVPGRTCVDLLPETIEQLSKLARIIGIKEATGNIARAQEIKDCTHANFEIYSGDDATALDAMLKGIATGVISVTANIAPAKMHVMCNAALNNNVELATKINQELALLHNRLFLEANPIPVKWALEKMGKIKSGIRLPLLPLDKKYHMEVKEAMQNAGVNT